MFQALVGCNVQCSPQDEGQSAAGCIQQRTQQLPGCLPCNVLCCPSGTPQVVLALQPGNGAVVVGMQPIKQLSCWGTPVGHETPNHFLLLVQ